MGSSKTMFGEMGSCALMVAMMMMMMACGVAGQGPAAGPASQPDCDAVVVNLVDCLGFISGTTETPTTTCCSNLSSIIQNTPTCLCQLYNTTLTGSLRINVTRAQQLPPACKLTTPDPSLCSLVGIPVAGPGAAPISPSSGPVMPPSSGSSPSAATGPSSTPMTPLSTPGTMTPPTTTTTPPPPNGNNAPSVAARSFAVASSMLFSFILIFH